MALSGIWSFPLVSLSSFAYARDNHVIMKMEQLIQGRREEEKGGNESSDGIELNELVFHLEHASAKLYFSPEITLRNCSVTRGKIFFCRGEVNAIGREASAIAMTSKAVANAVKRGSKAIASGDGAVANALGEYSFSYATEKESQANAYGNGSRATATFPGARANACGNNTFAHATVDDSVAYAEKDNSSAFQESAGAIIRGGTEGALLFRFDKEVEVEMFY